MKTMSALSGWSPTRAAGLARLEAFLPLAGRAYTSSRNIDRGPDDRSNISGLSPWIRRRMITEEEVVAAVLDQHGFPAAEKFIQEVFWRTYWKGWLEMRPSVFQRYTDERAALSQTWQDNPSLRAAKRGATGIEPFDAWARELIEYGWLHNHARMWFASIWIFTLGLPWQLGAGFFADHLLDADPASNTLSWRWVAGLHTRGKHYLARASNIRDHTLGRYNPVGDLNEQAPPLSENWIIPEPIPIAPGDQPKSARAAILLTEEDLHPESWGLEAEITACAALNVPAIGAAHSPAAQFSRGALEDAAARVKVHFCVGSEAVSDEDVADWAKRRDVTELITGYAPAGSVARSLDAIEISLRKEGIRLVRLQRAWDRQAWPHAKAGFFKLKKQIPRLINKGVKQLELFPFDDERAEIIVVIQ